jgi:uncharacterized repeat protein (TIGR04052 family)
MQFRPIPISLLATAAALGACGDNAHDHDHDHDPPDAATPPPDAAPQAVTIRFAAEVGGEAFACGQTYAGIGASASAYVGTDFRFYVHDVRLVGAGGDVPVTLDANAHQADGVALLDFETGGTGCQMGTVATHPAITGTVPIGTTYTGVKLRIGVPFANNHLDATLAVAPMNVPAMYWAWSSGYKFIKADGTANGQGFSLHVGSTGCPSSGTTPPGSPCASPNVIDVELTGFVPGTGVVVADVGRVLAEVDITVNTMDTAPGCMSFPGDPECDTVLPRLGLPYGAIPAGPQRFLSVE